jgi:hypothetical protein
MKRELTNKNRRVGGDRLDFRLQLGFEFAQLLALSLKNVITKHQCRLKQSGTE